MTEAIPARCYSCNAECLFHPHVASPTLPSGLPIPFCRDCLLKYFPDDKPRHELPPKYRPPAGERKE